LRLLAVELFERAHAGIATLERERVVVALRLRAELLDRPRGRHAIGLRRAQLDLRVAGREIDVEARFDALGALVHRVAANVCPQLVRRLQANLEALRAVGGHARAAVGRRIRVATRAAVALTERSGERALRQLRRRS